MQDITTATFCPCCSILRNELEVRTREEEKWNELHGPNDKGYSPEKPMTSALPDGIYSGKENRAPRNDSVPSASGSSLRNANASRRSSVSSTRQSAKDQNTPEKTPSGQASASVRSRSSSPSLSLTSSGNAETVTCTVVDDGHRQILHLNRAILTPVMERLSEDTMSTAKKSKVCASPPLQGENIPLGSIQESTPTDSMADKSATMSSPLVSRPTSPRKSIDRPPTPIPPMSPTLSGRSGCSSRKVPLVPVTGAVPSPVQELVEDGQVPAVAASSTAKTSRREGPFGAVGPPGRSDALSSGNLDKAPEVHCSTPHVMVEGWLDDVGSPAPRGSIDVHDHAFPQDAASTEKTSNESTITNATLTPPAFTPLPDEGRNKTLGAANIQDTTVEAVNDRQEVKQAGQPATALSALGTTITDVFKSLMPVSALPARNFPEHNVPIPHHPDTAPSLEPKTRTSVQTVIPAASGSILDHERDKTPRPVDTQDAEAETPQDVAAMDLADKLSTGDASDQSSKRRPSQSKIPRLSSSTPAPVKPAIPTIPPRPAVRVPTGFPLTTTPSVAVAVAATPTPPGTYPLTPAPVPPPDPEPATPAPPGQYPATPGTAATPPAAAGPTGEESPFGSGGDKGPFVSFRAKQLLGHFLARDTPKGSVDRVTARPSREGRGNSLCDDERVWGTVPRGGWGGMGGRGRGLRRGVEGTE